MTSDQVAMAESPEVTRARADAQPIVALESTIITHGMPWPQNLETAQAVEQAVRDAGAVPATIAVIDGALRIGLDTPVLEGFAKSRDVAKLSRADMAACLATGGTGATTVAATMIAARLAGIHVFATGYSFREIEVRDKQCRGGLFVNSNEKRGWPIAYQFIGLPGGWKIIGPANDVFWTRFGNDMRQFIVFYSGIQRNQNGPDSENGQRDESIVHGVVGYEQNTIIPFHSDLF